MLAKNKKECNEILEYYSKLGYFHLKRQQGKFPSELISVVAQNPNILQYQTTDIFGQEFEKISIILDESARYDGNKLKISKSSGDYHYDPEQTFYHNITRVKNELAIIVYNNKDVYDRLISITSVPIQTINSRKK